MLRLAGLFNTRDRAAHTRKRKIISHTFSARSIGQFETYMHASLDAFVRKWDALCADAEDESKGWVELNALHWMNYLAFDIIGDLGMSMTGVRGARRRCANLDA
ncbi:hypothetical protein MRB53_042022 [Persea americana]|nr:hypothetical protein MRB53_042022 [Persea americana]